MSALDAANRYFDAWNARNANAQGLWTAFPDLAFEMVSVAETGGGGH